MTPDDNILYFTRSKYAKAFTFYIRCIYINAAREAGISMPNYLREYRARNLQDPVQLSSEKNLLHIHDVFDDEVFQILDNNFKKFRIDMFESKLKMVQAAIKILVRDMYIEYKIA